MKKTLAIQVGGIILAATLSAAVCTAQTPGNLARSDTPTDTSTANTISPTNVDLRALKAQLEAFQAMLNRTIQQSFEQPFVLLQDVKGIYLPGFGVVFHMETSLTPIQVAMPFNVRPVTAEELQKARELKTERIRRLKTLLSQALLDQGGSLSAMAPEQNIAIVVHLFNMPSEGRDLPSQIVISLNRSMLLDYQGRRLTEEQFEKTGSVLEF
jgi:hypothetical protein